MATINFSDVIYATIMQRGCVVASVKLSGMTSFAAVLKSLKGAVKGSLGMVTLNLRNSSQGWSSRQALLMN